MSLFLPSSRSSGTGNPYEREDSRQIALMGLGSPRPTPTTRGGPVEMTGASGRTSSLSRRTLITRGIAAGGLVWAAPVVTSIGRAHGQAAGTPKPCDCTFCATVVPPVGPRCTSTARARRATTATACASPRVWTRSARTRPTPAWWGSSASRAPRRAEGGERVGIRRIHTAALEAGTGDQCRAGRAGRACRLSSTWPTAPQRGSASPWATTPATRTDRLSSRAA